MDCNARVEVDSKRPRVLVYCLMLTSRYRVGYAVLIKSLGV